MKKEILTILLLLLFHHFVEGYSYGINDQVLQIPLVKLAQDPDLYPSDYLRPTFSHQFTYFYKLIGFLDPSDKALETLYFIGYLLSFGFALFFLKRIAEKLTSDRESSYLAILLISAGYYPTPPWAYFDPFFSHRTIAFPFFLASIYLFLLRRYLPSLLLLGLLWNLHGLHSLHLTFILLFILWIRVKEIEWRKVLGYTALVFIPALPVILWKIASLQTPSSPEPWRRIFEILAGDQLFPLSWHIKTPIRVGIFLLYLLLAVRSLPLTRMESWLKRDLQLFFTAILLLCIGGVLITEVFPIRLSIEIQAFRSTVFFYLLCLPLVTHYLIEKFRGGDLWMKILVSILISAFISREVEFILLPFPYFFIDDFLPQFRKKGQFKFPLLTVIFFLYLLLILVGFGLLQGRDFRINLLSETTLFFITIASGLTSLVLFQERRKIRPFNGENPLLFLAILIGILTGFFYSTLTGTSKIKLQEEDWQEVQKWCRLKTPKTALFITPVTRSGFRVYSERGIVGEWYDGFWGPFVSQDLSRMWWERMRDFGIHEGNFRDREKIYNSLGEEDFVRIGRKYGATLVVTEKPKILNFRKVYENTKFLLYALPLS